MGHARAALVLWALAWGGRCAPAASALVFQSDFGCKDAAVAAMKGVAYSVSPAVRMFDLTHQIPAFNVWEAAFRLKQAAPYWPPGTVFVSVVDPGVGTDRRSVVLKTKTGHYVVSPDNGTLTLVAEAMGIAEVRQIDEATNRRPHSRQSYTFHGRDVYAYTGARLAAGAITFEQVGKRLPARVVAIAYQKPAASGPAVQGCIAVLDVQYGNVWTNIPAGLVERIGVKKGSRVRVTISNAGKTVFTGAMPFVACFADVPEGQPLAYLNSLLELSLALNMGNFAKTHHIGSGPDWAVKVEREHTDHGHPHRPRP